MRLRTLIGLAIPLAAALLFVRLGVWQLSRHGERARFNATIVDRFSAPPVAFAELPSEGDEARLRAVTLSGRFRYDLEQVHAGRTSAGSPGVYLLTPLEREGTDTLVVVNRGWVYSPDAASVEHSRWRERELVSLVGYALPLALDGTPPPAESSRPLRSVTLHALQARLGVPVAAVQVVMTSDSAARADSVPRRLPPPILDTGPFRSYAIQWFSFALIALVGGAMLFRRGIVADRVQP